MPLDLLSGTRTQADSHQLAAVGLARLDNRVVGHAQGLELLLERLEASLVGLEDHGVRAGAQVALRALSCCVCDLGCKDPQGEVRPFFLPFNKQ